MTTGKPLPITAIDISMSNIGIVHSLVHLDGTIDIQSKSLIEGAKAPSMPKGTPKNTELVHKINYLRDSLRAIHKYPNIVVELPTGSQSYSACLSYAISCSLVAELHDRHNVIHVSPTPCRTYLREQTNSGKEVSRQQLKKIGMQYVQDKYSLFTLNKKGNIPLKNEHVADAVIALEYYITTL